MSVAKFIKHSLNVASYLTLIIILGGRYYCFTILHVKKLRHRMLVGSRVEIQPTSVDTLHCHTILLPRMGCSWRY